MSKDLPIRWDREAKEKRDQERAQQEEEAAKRHVMAIISGEYKTWKKALLSKPRSRKEIIRRLYDLQTIIIKKVELAGLAKWKTFTLEMLEDKIGKAIRLDINKRNCITAYVPTIISPEGRVDEIAKYNATNKVREAVFETEEELREVEFVKRVASMDGFVGFVIDYPVLCAFFNDEELVKVGVLSNSIGVGKFPTWKEFQKGVLEDKTKGQKPKGN